MSLVILERGFNPGTTTGLVGLDQGQGSLKVALTLLDSQEEDKENHRASYSQVCFYSGYNFHDLILKSAAGCG